MGPLFTGWKRTGPEGSRLAHTRTKDDEKVSNLRETLWVSSAPSLRSGREFQDMPAALPHLLPDPKPLGAWISLPGCSPLSPPHPALGILFECDQAAAEATSSSVKTVLLSVQRGALDQTLGETEDTGGKTGAMLIACDLANARMLISGFDTNGLKLCKTVT